MEEFARDYFDLLNGEYGGINLTRITDWDEFWKKQILDSIEPLNQSEVFRDSLVRAGLHIDVGFGGGFPLLPLAYLLPDVVFIGIEARAKKAKVVNEMANKLGLLNVHCTHSRLENLVIDKPCTVSFKAVGKVNDFLSKIITQEKIQAFFYKGPNFYNIESNQIEQTKRSWNITEEIEIHIQDTQNRYIIGFENIHVPHGTPPKNNIMKLSQIINVKKKDSHG
jgi:16S rRNA (guanine527-N7)-methyltransferase